MINGLPQGWVSCKFEDCIEILDSIRQPINNTERQARIAGKDETKLFPYYGATGQVGYIDGYLFDGEFVALGEDGAPFFDPKKHKAYLLKGKTWVNNHAHVIKGAAGIDNRYICYLLNQADYHGYVNGATRLKLTQENMRRLPIVLAPLNEQNRIANKLDSFLAKVDAAQTRLEKIPNLLKRFRQSVLTTAISGELTKEWRLNTRIQWPEISKPLGEVITLAYGKSLPSKSRTGEDFPVYGSNGEIGRHNAAIVDGPFIIVGRKGSYGEVAWSDESGWPIDTTYFVQLKAKSNLKFIYFSLQTLGLNQLNRSTAIPGLNREDAYQKEIIVPELEEQKEIVRHIESLFALADGVEKQYLEAKKRIDRLSQSLLAKAFRGELVAQDPNDEPASELLKRIKVEREVKKSINKFPMKKSEKMNTPSDKVPPGELKIMATASTSSKISDRKNHQTSVEGRILEKMNETYKGQEIELSVLVDSLNCSYEELKKALFNLTKGDLNSSIKPKTKLTWDGVYKISMVK